MLKAVRLRFVFFRVTAMSDRPPNYRWTQKLGTILDDVAELTINGYEPRLWFFGNLPRNPVIVETRRRSLEWWLSRTGEECPPWWPFHADGTPVSHTYRLLDEYAGKDLIKPELVGALKDANPGDANVDFTLKVNAQGALMHVCKVSDGHYAYRPYVSVSTSLEDVV